MHTDNNTNNNERDANLHFWRIWLGAAAICIGAPLTYYLTMKCNPMNMLMIRIIAILWLIIEVYFLWKNTQSHEN